MLALLVSRLLALPFTTPRYEVTVERDVPYATLQGSINYRLGFHPLKKEVREAEMRALEDADAALAYLLGREDLHINPQQVFLAGTSVGAITALNMAYRPDPVSSYRICALASLRDAMAAFFATFLQDSL